MRAGWVPAQGGDRAAAGGADGQDFTMAPSLAASSIGALPIGPPPKNGQSTMASAPPVASQRPDLVKAKDSVFAG